MDINGKLHLSICVSMKFLSDWVITLLIWMFIFNAHTREINVSLTVMIGYLYRKISLLDDFVSRQKLLQCILSACYIIISLSISTHRYTHIGWTSRRSHKNWDCIWSISIYLLQFLSENCYGSIEHPQTIWNNVDLWTSERFTMFSVANGDTGGWIALLTISV